MGGLTRSLYETSLPLTSGVFLIRTGSEGKIRFKNISFIIFSDDYRGGALLAIKSKIKAGDCVD